MKRDGFSLVELLVVVSILTIVLGFGLASFMRFNRHERLKQAGLTLKSSLRFAQTKTISVEKPSSGCTTYIGIRLSFMIDGYTIQPECDPEGAAGSPTTVTFSQGLTFTAIPSTFMFLQQNVLDSVSEQALTITNGEERYMLVVSPSGNVSDKGFVL